MQLVGWLGLRRNALLMSGAMLASFCLAPSTAWADGKGPGLTIYVDDDAPSSPKGDGLTWQTAFRYLQDALHFAAEPDSGVAEIRVAQGVYKPDQGANVTPGDKNATFLIPFGLSLRGGYAGLTGDDPDARDIEEFQTILSGDLLGNDGPPGSFQNYSDNSVLIARVLSEPAPVIVEGLTITAATTGFNFFDPFTWQLGAAMRCEGGAPQVSHCRIEYNQAFDFGGLALFGCKDAVVSSCKFVSNRAFTNGGALNAKPFIGESGGRLTVVKCVFEGNRALLGGAMQVWNLDELEVADCVFLNNLATEDGGAIFIEPSSKVFNVKRTRFEGNVAFDTGGAVGWIGDFFDCEFINNGAGSAGGALDCALALGGGGYGGWGTMTNCRFIGNQTTFGGGAAIWGGDFVTNCEFHGNWTTAIGIGGAVRVGPDAQFTNCVINGSEVFFPATGAVYIDEGAHATFTNCTITNNGGPTPVGGIGGAGTAEIVNSIVWGNTGAQLEGAITASGSCIQNNWPGEGNIDLDPMFINALGPDGMPGTEDDDLRFHINSPCIDAGDNSALPSDGFDLNRNGNIKEPLPIDLTGNPRIAPRWPNWPKPHIVDMGAFEFQPPRLGDLNIDGVVNEADLLLLLESWGNCSQPPVTCPPDLAPPGGDDIVNVDDLLMLLANWG